MFKEALLNISPSKIFYEKNELLSKMKCQVPCHDCDFVYIVQTKISLKPQLVEHKESTGTKYQWPEQPALYKYSISMDHKIKQKF